MALVEIFLCVYFIYMASPMTPWTAPSFSKVSHAFRLRRAWNIFVVVFQYLFVYVVFPFYIAFFFLHKILIKVCTARLGKVLLKSKVEKSRQDTLHAHDVNLCACLATLFDAAINRRNATSRWPGGFFALLLFVSHLSLLSSFFYFYFFKSSTLLSPSLSRPFSFLSCKVCDLYNFIPARRSGH